MFYLCSGVCTRVHVCTLILPFWWQAFLINVYLWLRDMSFIVNVSWPVQYPPQKQQWQGRGKKSIHMMANPVFFLFNWGSSQPWHAFVTARIIRPYESTEDNCQYGNRDTQTKSQVWMCSLQINVYFRITMSSKFDKNWSLNISSRIKIQWIISF